MRTRRVLCSIVPPHILRNIAEQGDERARVQARAALELSTAPRRERQAVATVAGMLTLGPRRKRRTVFDARNGSDLPGRNVRGEGSRRVRDVAVNEAYDGAGKTYDFFRRVYGRFSIDDHGVRLDSTVHYGDTLQQRALERPADDLRRRRRQVLQPIHLVARRHRARADARYQPVHRRFRADGAGGGARRTFLRRFRHARETVTGAATPRRPPIG